MANWMQSATQLAMCNCAVGLGFRVRSPYCHGRDCGTPKPGKKKQKLYDHACAVLIIHRFPFSLLLTLVVRKVRLEVTSNNTHFVSLSQSSLTADSSSRNAVSFSSACKQFCLKARVAQIMFTRHQE